MINKIIYSNNGVNYPKGFKAVSTNCGLKENRDDITLIYSDVPAECAIVVTLNQVKAAPVLWDLEITEDGSKKQAVIINVGSANACTGEEGLKNATVEAETVAKNLSLESKEVLVCSTGVIGEQLDMNKITSGINFLTTEIKETAHADKKVAASILTTDTKIKLASASFMIGDKEVRIGAMCKGSGMIRPNMATMLSFVCTDCNIEQDILSEMLRKATKDSYNMISVDGDMSTNDTALILANGLAENKKIEDINSPDGQLFYKALLEIQTTLAKKIIEDGEGANKIFEVNVKNALTKEDARILAHSVIESNLVKAAIFGGDANWGRILSSLGASSATIDPNQIVIDADNIIIFEKGSPTKFNVEKLDEIFNNKEITLNINCNLGEEYATGWGCDLSYEYVKINGEYRS